MALTAGTRFGPYEIAESIGAGGMGEVYRAHDTTLERDVAIKVLPASFAEDRERVERFEREAKTLAALNHPNIAQVHGLEKADGRTAIVMELVEGSTLADRIAQGPIPADEALGIAMQIADALEAAHGQNIVHRDLKPANVTVRPDGIVKVLDFGIAKAFDIQATSGSGAPALTTPAMTQTGIILGTAAYMSPEQARGKFVDDRTDVWAFGCLVYEMLTGQPAFAGEDVAITLARILANETDMKSLPGMVSPAVRQTIELCLRKDPKKRLADIRDVKLALEGAFDTVASQPTTATTRLGWKWVLPGTALAAVGIVVGGTFWPEPETAPLPVNRFIHVLPEGQAFRNTSRSVVAVSPTGRHFIYDRSEGLALRAMDDFEARAIPGTGQQTVSPVFSPDGQWVAYWDGARLQRIAISGGAPVLIAEIGPPIGLIWGADGMILSGQAGGVYRVSATGGTPELIIPVEDEQWVSGPELLPDGDSVLFSALPSTGANSWDQAQIVVQSLSTGERTVLINGGSEAHYLSTGHIVYAIGNGLFAVVFDLDSLTVSGGAVPLVQGVRRAPSSQTGAASYSISEDGTLVYVIGDAVTGGENALVWVNRDGREEEINAPPRNYTGPRISPDETKVAFAIRDQENDIWTWDLARETLTRLTFDPGLDRSPAWSPDSQRIAYGSQEGGGDNLFWKAADGTGPAVWLAESDRQIFPTSFLPDATEVLVYGASSGGDDNDDIAVFSLEDDSLRPLMQTTFGERYPVLSPDGRWLAYVSNESGREEVYVRPYPEIDAGRWQVSTGGGTHPLWARNGQELFFRNAGAVVAVSVETDSSFTAGTPQVLFEHADQGLLGGRNYDVSSDGTRFLMINPITDPSTVAQVMIVQNWFEEVRRLAPTD